MNFLIKYILITIKNFKLICSIHNSNRGIKFNSVSARTTIGAFYNSSKHFLYPWYASHWLSNFTSISDDDFSFSCVFRVICMLVYFRLRPRNRVIRYGLYYLWAATIIYICNCNGLTHILFSLECNIIEVVALWM